MKGEGERGMVSVVIPIYNGEKFLEKAVRSCVGQNRGAMEVILVDDGSADGSRELADRLAGEIGVVRCEHQEKNLGVSAAWNRGFSAARGRWLLRLAQDDCLVEGAVERLVEFAERQPEAGGFYADGWAVGEDGGRRLMRTSEAGDLFRRSQRIGLCVMISAEVWRMGERYDLGYRAAEDLEFFTRLAERGVKFVKVEGEPLLEVLVHGESGSSRMAAEQEWETAKILERSTLVEMGVKRRVVGEHYVNAVYGLRKAGRRVEAVERGWEGLRRRPFCGGLWREALLVLVWGRGKDR